MNFGFHTFWRTMLHLTISEPLLAQNALFNSEDEQRNEMKTKYLDKGSSFLPLLLLKDQLSTHGIYKALALLGKVLGEKQ